MKWPKCWQYFLLSFRRQRQDISSGSAYIRKFLWRKFLGFFNHPYTLTDKWISRGIANLRIWQVLARDTSHSSFIINQSSGWYFTSAECFDRFSSSFTWRMSVSRSSWVNLKKKIWNELKFEIFKNCSIFHFKKHYEYYKWTENLQLFNLKKINSNFKPKISDLTIHLEGDSGDKKLKTAKNERK